ncbi:MAG: hypothetical protein IPK16_27540 [Anaerolineales bacterium]|nr:hypothetical protein [Anaerolineales bacterium]
MRVTTVLAFRDRIELRFTRLATGLVLAVVTSMFLAGCQPVTRPATSAGATAAPNTQVAGNICPMVFDASVASFFPIQPSFDAGYSLAGQKLNSDTQDWAYVITGDYPYSYWMSWYLYSTKGVPLFKIAGKDIAPDPGSTNPFVTGNPILAPDRKYTIIFMPADTPADVISSMQEAGQNVALLPEIGSTEGASLVSRSYWPLSNDGLGDYDRFGYGGPTNTPAHTLSAFLTDPTTGELTNTPVADCAAQSQLPQAIWYNPATKEPVITFEFIKAPEPKEYADLPKFVLQTGSAAGVLGEEFPPSPVPSEVQFYRNVAANAPYADVASAPPLGDPPDACGGYVMANLPNDVVSLIHVPQVPSFPDYQGATDTTVNNTDDFDVSYYSVVVYGALKQLSAVGTMDNSQIGNRQININDDGSATVVLYPRSATPDQIEAIKAVVDANGWNLLTSGLQTNAAPNLVVVREKGPNSNWKNALSPNAVTAGAPCPQTANPSLPLPQDPPEAQVTQFNGMGLSAPQGQNCSIDEFLSGKCLEDFGAQLAADGAVWSATSATPPAQVMP